MKKQKQNKNKKNVYLLKLRQRSNFWSNLIDFICKETSTSSMILRAAVFYRIAILSNSFIGGFFVVKLKYVFLQRKTEVCNSVTGIFLRIFLSFWEWSLFKTLGYCFSFSRKLLLCFCFPCLTSFNKYVYVTNFAQVPWHPLMKNYLTFLKSKTVDFKIILSTWTFWHNMQDIPLKDVSIWVNLSLTKYLTKIFSRFFMFNNNGKQSLKSCLF